MNYNSDANSQDCVSEVLAICGATTATYPVNDITRRFNAALDAYFDLAIDSAGPWPMDDNNQASAALVTQNLVSGTNAYKIKSFSGSVVGVLGVYALDDNATSHKLTGEDFLELDFDKDYSTSWVGAPSYYTLYGDFIYLRPTPNYNETNGLRVFVNRAPLYMLTTDTGKEPGIPKAHHFYLCRKTALPYLIEKRLPQAVAIAQLITKDEDDIRRYYARRDKATVHRLTPMKQDNR